jgi:dolichyl-diphosphooligosaccharide--protein glycosyltransferase
LLLLLSLGSLFLILYGITAVYFSGVMVRLMLVLAPAVCCLAGVAISDILSTLTVSLKLGLPAAMSGVQSALGGGSSATLEGGEASSNAGTLVRVPDRWHGVLKNGVTAWMPDFFFI